VSQGKHSSVDLACTAKYCKLPSLECFTEADCVQGLLCADKCMGLWDQDPSPQKLLVQNCSNTCLATYADSRYQGYMNCMTENKCISFSGINDTCLAPRPNPDLSMKDLVGSWWVLHGLHPLYDCFNCDRFTISQSTTSDWLTEISYTATTVNSSKVNQKVVWPVNNTAAGQPITGSCQGCFVKGMPHWETWYLLDKDPHGAWAAMYYCGGTMSWHYHGALVLGKEAQELSPANTKLLDAVFSKLNITYNSNFCAPQKGASCGASSAHSPA